MFGRRKPFEPVSRTNPAAPGGATSGRVAPAGAVPGGHKADQPAEGRGPTLVTDKAAADASRPTPENVKGHDLSMQPPKPQSGSVVTDITPRGAAPLTGRPAPRPAPASNVRSQRVEGRPAISASG